MRPAEKPNPILMPSNAHRKRRPREDGVDEVEDGRHEEEGELDRLGYACQERGEGCREEDARGHLRDPGVPDHREARRGESEHHDREEAGEEVAGGGVSGEVAGDLTVHRTVRPLVGP